MRGTGWTACVLGVSIAIGCANASKSPGAGAASRSDQISCAHPDYKSRSCWLSGSPAELDLELYTTGLNHHENDPVHNVVDQAGVRAL
ncbi:MAG TPA: hypothetical protein VL463_06600, partial [Kofleriaceae bacterium]|nr:hypothetical protein [Kofleriaceae bacterium]